MKLKLLIFLLSITSLVFAEKIPAQLRAEFGLKMHQGFCLQSAGQSGSAFFRFSEGYQAALKAGISPKKLQAIWNLFIWYRKYGRYLGLFDTSGHNNILDEYRGEESKTKRFYHFRSETDKKRDQYEIAEISRELVIYTGEIIGGLLGFCLLPNLSLKASSLAIAIDGTSKLFLGLNRLKTFNDIAKHELQQRKKELDAAAANSDDEEWWLN